MTTTEPHVGATAAGPDLTQLDTWERGGTYTTFRGHRVFYRRGGAGPVLVCVHGYPTASWDWHKLWPGLVQRFDVVAPDMLGFGFTDKPKGHAYSIVEQAELHLALLAELGIHEAHLLCHDYGVSVGQELLARHAEGRTPRWRSITLLNGGLLPEMHRPRPIQRVLASPIGPLVSRLSGPGRFSRSLARVFGPHTQPTRDELNSFYALVERGGGKRALAELIVYMEERRAQRERWVGALLTTEVPLRLINGVHDPVSGGHLVDRLEQLRPGLDAVRLPVGHYPQVEAPAEVLAALLEFVARCDPRVAP